MKIVIRILVTAAALAVAAWVVPGIHTEQWTLHGTGAVSNDASIAKTLIIVAIIFGIVNAILKPVIKAVGCAFYLLTLGLIAIVAARMPRDELENPLDSEPVLAPSA